MFKRKKIKDMIPTAIDPGDIIEKVGNAIDKNFESSEERQEQLTRRQELDAEIGSWLTNNIRPLTLACLLFYWLIGLPILTSFNIIVPDKQVEAVEMLSLAAFGFYFGSRGFEKVNKIRMRRRDKKK